MAEPRDPLVAEPLQRRTFPAAELVRQHPPMLRNRNKQVLFGIASPAGAVHSGRLEFSRWPEIPLPPPREIDQARAARLAVVRDGFFDYRPVLDSGVGVEWHVNFADPNLFYAYGSALFAQDEIQVAEHPVLGSLREALFAEGQPTTTIACGAFGGNRVMMTLLQFLAADMAGVARLVLHIGDPSGRTSVERALVLAPDLATATSATELIARAEALGLVWGVNDGN